MESRGTKTSLSCCISTSALDTEADHADDEDDDDDALLTDVVTGRVI